MVLINCFRYLFYDINFPEGFNLRRDVYVRFAVLAHQMNKSSNPLLNNFYLVLPPWSNLIHWKSNRQLQHIPWNLYFDLESLKKFAPVIEIHDFFKGYCFGKLKLFSHSVILEYSSKYSKVIIDEVYTLQHFEDMFETGNFEEKMKITKCQQKNHHTFFFYNNITSNVDYCILYSGAVTKLKELFINTEAKYVLMKFALID